MSSRILRYYALAVTLALLLLTGPGARAQTAGGEDGGPYLQLREVDSRDADETALQVAWSGDAGAVDDIDVTENGEPVDATARPADIQRGVVLVVDSSEAMDATMPMVKRAATRFVDGLPDGTEIAVVRFSDRVQLIRDFTDEKGDVTNAIEGMVPRGSAHLWDGIFTGVQALEEEPELQPNIVVISGSPDLGSGTTINRVNGAASSLGAAVFAVALPGSDPEALEGVVGETGGRLLTANELGETLNGPVLDSINNQYTVTFPTEVKAGDITDLTLSVGDISTEATIVDGHVARGDAELAPKHGSSGGGIGFLQTPMAKLLGVVLALVAVVLGVYALVLVFTKDEGALASVLQPYSEGYSPGGDGDEDDEDGETSFAKNVLIQRAVDFTEDFAERQGFLAKTEAALERADLPLRAAEALFFYGAVVVMLFIVLLLLTGNFMIMLVLGGVMALIPPVIVNFKASKRRKAFMSQLPDTLQLLSGTLRAGYSLMQGVEAVSQEVAEPMGAELRRVVTESRLGRPLEESLEASAERMASPDFSWAVMAIRIQREVGGNLAELLLTVADTMTQRERLRRDVAALTAEGKVSAIVLGILPLGLAGAMYMINRPYISTLFTNRLGNFMLGYAVISAGIGFYWMKKTIEIEI